MKAIRTDEIKNCSVTVPGSKSYSHRTLIAAALSNGRSTVSNCLKSEDTLLTAEALRKMGVSIEEKEDIMIVEGAGGKLQPQSDEIYLANSGTSMRLLTSIAAIGQGPYVLNGTKRMQERPIQDLLNGLNQIGISARSINNTDCPPIEVVGAPIKGGSMTLDCSISSQFLSSVLLMAPLSREGIEIKLAKAMVSKPYVEMTLDIMDRFGITLERHGFDRFYVPGGQIYQAGDYAVESDCSQASYFWGAAAVTGKSIKVNNVSFDSRQGDVQFAKVLEKMGCKVVVEQDGITVQGGSLKGVEVDMANMPDVVPTLAVVASFAEGTTVVTNVEHLREKECDRLGCVATELIKLGIDATATESGLVIKGGKHKAAEIDTYDDHRMAMCFAITGLKVENVVIKDELCVKKSFPNYWEVFEGMYA